MIHIIRNTLIKSIIALVYISLHFLLFFFQCKWILLYLFLIVQFFKSVILLSQIVTRLFRQISTFFFTKEHNKISILLIVIIFSGNNQFSSNELSGCPLCRSAFSVLHQVVTRHVHRKSICSSDGERLWKITMCRFQNGRNFQKLPTYQRSSHLSLDLCEERRPRQGTHWVVGGQVCVSLWFTQPRMSTVQMCTSVHIHHRTQEKELYECLTGNIPSQCWLYASEACTQVRRKSNDSMK